MTKGFLKPILQVPALDIAPLRAGVILCTAFSLRLLGSAPCDSPRLDNLRHHLVRHEFAVEALADDADFGEVIAAHGEDVHRIGFQVEQFAAELDDLVDAVGFQVAQVDAFLDVLQAEVQAAVGDLAPRAVFRDVVDDPG